jgi:hypothetical protein
MLVGQSSLGRLVFTKIHVLTAALLAASQLACDAPSSALPDVKPPVNCALAEPGRNAPMIPLDIEAAVRVLTACTPAAEWVRAGATELDFIIREDNYIGGALRYAWLREPDSTLFQDLTRVGFEYNEDMSAALFSIVWHRLRSVSMDIDARAKCVHAWNREMKRLAHSVPPGTNIPALGFSCGHDGVVEAGRRKWELIK